MYQGVDVYSHCLRPVRIFNKYTHSYEYVSCGKCVACLQRAANIQSLRVSNEIKQHRYSVMFTLTYDNEFLPKYEIFADCKGRLQVAPVGRAVDLFKYIPLNYRLNGSDICLFEDDTFIPRIRSYEDAYQFGVCSKVDIQNFIKRLRYWINKDKDIYGKAKEFRYYIASEYGPKTFRPHYHGVLFFDSKELLSKIQDFIVKSWGLFARRKGGKRNEFTFIPFADVSLTRENVKLCDANASIYVAQYVAGNCDLPTVLQLRSTRPFHLCSKNPIIGEFKIDGQKVFEDIDRGVIEDSGTLFDKSSGSVKFVSFPYSADTLGTLFGKCFSYSELSFDAKLARYRFFGDKFSEWREKVDVAYQLWLFENSFSSLNNSLSKFIYYHRDWSFKRWCELNYPVDFIDLDMDKVSTWQASKKAYYVCSKYDLNKISSYVDVYVTYVRLFDKMLFLLQQYKLKHFYETQSAWIDQVGPLGVFSAYPFFFEELPKSLNAVPRWKWKSKEFRLIRDISRLCDFYPRGKLDVDFVSRLREENTNIYISWRTWMYRDRLNKSKSKKVNNTEVFGNLRML